MLNSLDNLTQLEVSGQKNWFIWSKGDKQGIFDFPIGIAFDKNGNFMVRTVLILASKFLASRANT